MSIGVSMLKQLREQSSSNNPNNPVIFRTCTINPTTAPSPILPMAPLVSPPKPSLELPVMPMALTVTSRGATHTNNDDNDRDKIAKDLLYCMFEINQDFLQIWKHMITSKWLLERQTKQVLHFYIYIYIYTDTIIHTQSLPLSLSSCLYISNTYLHGIHTYTGFEHMHTRCLLDYLIYIYIYMDMGVGT